MRSIAKKNKKIAVVIPCYNEAEGIAQVIKKFPRKKLAKSSFSLEVYVVDNNSTDNTALVAKQAGATVIHEPKKGKGHALRAGFRAVADDTDYVAMLDGDDTYSAQEIMRMIEPLHSKFCDVVIGSRLGGHIQKDAMTSFNRLGNWVFTNGVRSFYRANVTDVLTGYFAWKKSALDSLHPNLKSEGFAIEMEMVTKMARLGLHMTSVPVSYHPRAGESSLHPVKDGLRILKMFLKNITWQPKQSAKGQRKIVFVSDSIYPYMKGGKEKRLHEISKRLATMGYDVHIYTMHWWKTPEKERIEHGVHLHALCNYHEMYSGNRRTIKEGVMFGLACFRLLRVKFDVLDVDHMPFFPILSSWIVCKLRRQKFYGTWHEALSHKDWTSYMGPSGFIAALLERISVRLPHAITAASAHTQERLATIHRRAEGVSLVASGIDTALIRSIQPADIDCDILYIGRLVKDKNIDQLIKAVRKLTQQDPQVHCIIVGNGIEKPRLKRLAKKFALQKNVKFLTSIPEAADIYAYMKAAKVFCIPSVREGFSIVTLEALGCGTPVVTANTTSNAARHLVLDGENGSIVAPKSDELAQALQYWLAREKPDYALATADYDWQSLAQKQIEVYSQ